MLFARPRAFLVRDFHQDVAALSAYNQRHLGSRPVPVATITGTVGRTDLRNGRTFARWTRTGRYRAIYGALREGAGLPPVDLYLLDGHYYVRDGHHRVAAAREIGILDVDAEVIECTPTLAGPALAWHRARAGFEHDTGLRALHVRDAAGYESLRRQIAEHAWYLGERGRAPRSFKEAAASWERDVYQPVLTALARWGAFDRVSEMTVAEVYLAVCDHKWYVSERLGHDVGFAPVVSAFALRQAGLWRRLWGRLTLAVGGAGFLAVGQG